MSETITNLKVRFGADTKNFKSDMESGKAAVTNFTGAAGGAFAEFASIFGVNMGAVSGSLASVNKSLALLSGGFKGATAGATLFSGALKVLRLALISTGIGAIIVALGSLVAYFTKTERGAEAIERVMASVGAVFKVLTDRASELGEVIVNAFSNPKQTITELWEFIKSQFVNRITAIPRVIEAAWKLVKGIFNGTMGEAAKEYASALTQLGTGLDKSQQNKVVNYFKAVGSEIKNEAQQALTLEKALQALEDREIALIVVQGKRKQAIAELREQAKRDGISAQERLSLLDQVITLEKQVTADEVSLQKERVRIETEKYNMSEKMDDANRSLSESTAQLNNLEAEGLNNIRALSRERNKAIKEIDAEAEAIMKLRLEESKDLKVVAPIKLTVDKETGLFNQTKLPAPEVLPMETDKLEASAAKIKSIYGDMKTTVMDFSSVFQDSMAGAASGLGESLGQMLAGSASFSDLGAFVGQTMADMAISVGNIAIGVGVAALGIGTALKTAISTPAGAIAAIAAGTALVALGSWAKSSLSSAASGGGGTYSSSGGGSYDTGTPSAAPQNIRSAPMTIYVNGEFRAAGRDLVAVIDKNAQRKAITT